jgi:hypothetical protein
VTPTEQEALDLYNAHPGHQEKATEAERAGSIIIVSAGQGPLAAYRVHDGHIQAVAPR